MNKHSALETLIDLAGTATEDAAKRLGLAVKAGEEAQAKLVMLQQYREEYAARFQASLASGLGVMEYRNFQVFLDKLDTAVASQQQVIANLQRRIEKEREAWRESERKRLSYGTLLERTQKDAQHKEDKRTQKAMDEYAARQALRQQR